jgi:6-phosphogluconolactonase (cycloisomerase 2 family)
MKMQMRWLLPPILILTFLALAPPKANAQREFVYTNDSEYDSPNTVTAFSIESDGMLESIPGSPFHTGAMGTPNSSAGDLDTLIRVQNKFLFVSNYGSVSVFGIDPKSGKLLLVPGSPFAIVGPLSGYGIALAVSPDRRFLFAGDTAEGVINVFTIAENGGLSLVSGSPFDIGSHFGDMKVTSGNRFLIISLDYGQIGVYKIFANGTFAPISGSPFPITALGIDVNCSGSLLFAGSQSPEISVLHIADDGSLTPIPGSPFRGPGVNFDTVALNPTDTLLYVDDLLKSWVVGFSIAETGRLSLVPGSPFKIGVQPSGLAPDEDGRFLFVASLGSNYPSELFSFAVGSRGALNMVPGSPFLTGRRGNLASLATFPGKTCP